MTEHEHDMDAWGNCTVAGCTEFPPPSPVSTPDTPMVVTVCGSMRFKDLMLRVAEEATAAGWIVLMPHSVVAQQDQDGEFKAMLDRLHRAKIDLSQAIIVVSDETGYYGESTRGEIQYAKGTGKQVRYLSVATPSPVATPDTREAVSAEAIICAGVIVGVGGESDPCVTQEQADRATRLIVRELTKHGLLRPARATPTPVAEDGRDTAIRLLAEKQHRRYDSEFDASHLGWQDFAGSAAGHSYLYEVSAQSVEDAADAVMPVLAEALAAKDAEIAELRSLLRARDENLHTEAEGWKDMVSALGAQEARAKTERDLGLWLHAEATWRYDTSIRDCALVLIAQRDGVAETLGMLHDTAMGGLCDAIRLLRWLHAEAVWRDQARHGLLDDLAREQTARCDAQGDFREALRQRDQARAERDRLSTLLRGMARRPSQIRREAEVNVGHLANYTDKLIDLTAELDELRERAVVLPQDWRIALGNELSEHGCFEDDFASHVDADLDDVLTAVGNTIESWRPSTGDTDGTRARAELRCTATTTHPLYGRVQCQVQRGHEGIHGRLHSNSHFGVHWEDAVFPEEHAEPEPAWGVDRPVHGHTEQTGDQ